MSDRPRGDMDKPSTSAHVAAVVGRDGQPIRDSDGATGGDRRDHRRDRNREDDPYRSSRHRDDRDENHHRGSRDGERHDDHRRRDRDTDGKNDKDKDERRDRDRDVRNTDQRDRDRDRDRNRSRERDRRDRNSRPDRRARSRSRSRSYSPAPRSHRNSGDRDRDRHHHRSRRDRSPSPSSSSSSSDSDRSEMNTSEEERERKKRRHRREKEKRRDKHNDRDRERTRDKKDKKESRDERKARKDKKREKKAKKLGKGKTAAVTSQWGTYGLISEADQGTKEGEFRAWLVEERHINPETLAKDKQRKEFATFVEDYNTATLPHEKYYDMGKHELKMKMVREGETLPLNDGYDPMADLKAHSSSLKRPTVETDTYLSRAQLEDLRRVQKERTELAQRKVLGLDVSRDLGVRKEEQNKLWK